MIKFFNIFLKKKRIVYNSNIYVSSINECIVNDYKILRNINILDKSSINIDVIKDFYISDNEKVSFIDWLTDNDRIFLNNDLDYINKYIDESNKLLTYYKNVNVYKLSNDKNYENYLKVIPIIKRIKITNEIINKLLI